MAEGRIDGMRQLTQDVADIKTDLAKLMVAVIGDDKFGQDGLVDSSKDHERRISVVEKKWDRAGWTVAAATAAGALSGGGILWSLIGIQ